VTWIEYNLFLLPSFRSLDVYNEIIDQSGYRLTADIFEVEDWPLLVFEVDQECLVLRRDQGVVRVCIRGLLS
jgi:hypothetical protein